MLAWKIAPALATGNTVVLKPAEFTPLTALVFAEICAEAGLPAGVVNIVTGDGSTGEALVKHPDVDKIAFTGSTEVGRAIRSATASSHKRLSLELGGKSPFIIFEDADLDSAVEGLVDGIWFNQGQVCCAGSRLLMQESIAEPLISKVRDRMSDLRTGAPLDKAIDIGAIVDSSATGSDRATWSTQGVAEGATCWQPKVALPSQRFLLSANTSQQCSSHVNCGSAGNFRPGARCDDFPHAERSRRTCEQHGLWSGFLRLEREHQRRAACRFATQSRRGLGQLHKSCSMPPADSADTAKADTAAKAAREGLLEYWSPPGSSMLQPLPAAKARTAAESDNHPMNASAPAIDRTVKLYIGGKQARPDSGYSMEVRSPDGRLLGEAGLGNRKDIRNAVEAARKARLDESDCAQSCPGSLLLRRESLRSVRRRDRAPPGRSRLVKIRRRQKSNSASSASSPTQHGRTSLTARYTTLLSATLPSP